MNPTLNANCQRINVQFISLFQYQRGCDKIGQTESKTEGRTAHLCGFATLLSVLLLSIVSRFLSERVGTAQPRSCDGGQLNFHDYNAGLLYYEPGVGGPTGHAQAYLFTVVPDFRRRCFAGQFHRLCAAPDGGQHRCGLRFFQFRRLLLDTVHYGVVLDSDLEHVFCPFLPAVQLYGRGFHLPAHRLFYKKGEGAHALAGFSSLCPDAARSPIPEHTPVPRYAAGTPQSSAGANPSRAAGSCCPLSSRSPACRTAGAGSRCGRAGCWNGSPKSVSAGTARTSSAVKSTAASSGLM